MGGSRSGSGWIFLLPSHSDMTQADHNGTAPLPPEHNSGQDDVPVPAPVAVKCRSLKWLRWLLAGVVTVLLAVVLLIGWAVKSESGTRVFFAVVDQLTAGSIQTNGVRGTLSHALEIDQFRYRDASTGVQASGVQLAWQPQALWRRELVFERLHISYLQIATLPSNTPVSLPQQLTLPLSLNAADLAVGRLQVADMLADGKQKEVLALTALQGQLTYHQNQYQARLRLNSPWGKLETGAVSLSGARPFSLRGNARLQGRVLQDIPPVSAQLQISGDLTALQLALQAELQQSPAGTTATTTTTAALRLSGTASALLAPFETQIIRQAQIDIRHLNPADWSAQAPQADLRILADLQPETIMTPAAAPNKNPAQKTAAAVTGQIRVTNGNPGTLNRHALPLEGLQSSLLWRDDLLDIRDLKLRLTHQGEVQGGGKIQFSNSSFRADARLKLANVDLKALHPALRSTHIQGELSLRTDAQQVMQLSTQLKDAQAVLKADAGYDIRQQLLTLSSLHLQAGQAQLEGKGTLALRGEQAFHFAGNLGHFNPAYWADTEAGELHAGIRVDGRLTPDVQLQVKLPQLQGQYAGQPVQAEAEFMWLHEQLRVSRLDLRWGDNHLSGHGVAGTPGDSLQLALEAHDLSAFNPLLRSQQLALRGRLDAALELQGRFRDLAGQVTLDGSQIGIARQQKNYTVASLNGKLQLAGGDAGLVAGELNVQQLAGDFPGSADADPLSSGKAVKISQLQLQLSGKKDDHRLSAQMTFPGKQQFSAALQGALNTGSTGSGTTLSRANQRSSAPGAGWDWHGELQTLTLSGKADARLMAPAAVQINAQTFRIGKLQLQSALGALSVDQLEWANGQLMTQGTVSNARVLELVNLLRPQYAVTGNLTLNAAWNLQLKDTARGDISIQRQGGDLRFNDPDGTATAIPLGIRDARLKIHLGGLVAGTDGERISLQMSADGSRLGQWQITADSWLHQAQGQWQLPPEAALNGQVSAVIPDLEWLGPLLNPGLVLKGKLNLDAQLSGNLEKPRYRAAVSGRELELAFASEGLLLPNGTLDAQIEDNHLTLNQLQFSNVVTMLPQHAQFKGAEMLGKRGLFTASGEVDIGKETGAIQAQWQQFPLLQRKDRWLIVSGQASIVEANHIWSLTGGVKADGAYFRLPKLPPPSLSGDVNVTRKNERTDNRTASDSSARKGLKTRVDVSFEMGPRFVFVGRGLDTGLEGSLRLRSVDGSPLQATGSINTVRGVYEGYGQQLAIERGILNFQGPPANPGLNIRALRQGLAVEAGVEVVGTVVAPQVRLVSEPAVPDAEKLSWLVLGRGSDQLAGGDASLLMSAATAIFGGDGSRNVPRDIVQGLGFDEFSIGSAGRSSTSHVPGQTVAGTTGVSSSNSGSDQVISVGKRLMPGLVLSVERGLGDASGAIRLSWQLTRRITVVGRTGSESAVDVTYTFSFN